MDKEKKDSEGPEVTYTVQGDTFAGSWAPAYENMTVSYDSSDAGDINEMMRQDAGKGMENMTFCLLYTSPSPRDATLSRMPSSA